MGLLHAALRRQLWVVCVVALTCLQLVAASADTGTPAGNEQSWKGCAAVFRNAFAWVSEQGGEQPAGRAVVLRKLCLSYFEDSTSGPYASSPEDWVYDVRGLLESIRCSDADCHRAVERALGECTASDQVGEWVWFGELDKLHAAVCHGYANDGASADLRNGPPSQLKTTPGQCKRMDALSSIAIGVSLGCGLIFAASFGPSVALATTLPWLP